MKNCLLTHFIYNKEIKSSCDFNPFEFENQKSIYEVIRVIDGIPLFLEDHLLRLLNSLHINKINATISEYQLKTRIKALIEVNKLSVGNIKLQIKIVNNDFYAFVIPSFYPTKEQINNGVDCSLMKAKRNNPNSKTTNFELVELAQNQKQEKNSFEVILFDELNTISEGSRSNLFFIKNGTIFTSPDEKVLLGISRKKIIEICNQNNIKVKKENILTTQLIDFDSAFLSGTSINALPINSIETLNYNTDNVTLSLIKNGFSEIITEYLKYFKWNL